MKRPFYRKPVPRFMTVEDLGKLRQRILQIMLVGGVVAGLVAVIMNMIEDVPQGNWTVVAVYIVAFVWILLITFIQRLPYRVRALGFLLVPYALGITAALQDGIAGDGRIWMMGFIALSSILLGFNAGVMALGTGMVTLLVIGWMMSRGLLALPLAQVAPSSAILMDWAAASAVFLLIAIILIISLAVFVNGLSASLEKEKSMAGELADDREKLDHRTRELDRRLLQIRTAAEISQSISAVLEPNALLQQVVEFVRERLDLYYVGVFLLNETGDLAVLHAATGEAGMQMIAEEHHFPVDRTSMIGWTISNRRPHIALDVGKDAVRFSNPLLPLTRSEVSLPLISGDDVFGAMTVQSTHSRAFDEDDVTVLQGIAHSVATALQNARLFQQEKKNLAEIQALNRQYLVDAWAKATLVAGVTQYTYQNKKIADAEGESHTVNLPMKLREQVIGKVVLEGAAATLSPEDEAFVQQVIYQAALAMENVRLLEETQRRAGRERLVGEIVQKARASGDVGTIFRTALGELGKALRASNGEILLKVAEPAESSRKNGRSS